MITSPHKRIKLSTLSFATAFLFISSIVPILSPVVASAVTQTRQQQFESAAKIYSVPVELLLAISYNQTRWESHKGQVSASGGYGLMHLTTDAPAKENAKGDGTKAKTQKTEKKLLDEASSITNQPLATLKNDDAANINGAAALLAKYAGSEKPSSLDTWFDVTKKFSSYSDDEAATRFANAVYETISKGASATTSDNQTLTITPRDVTKDIRELPNAKSKQKVGSFKPECPRTISCEYIPAAYELNSADPNDYGNYEPAHRPKNLDIKYIVIHNTEGSYDSTVNAFQDPTFAASSHYVVRSNDGHIAQMVKNKDVAWHAGNMYINNHSIGIEHEGFAIDGASWYTEEMYQSSARLVRYLADTYKIPLDRQHIIGHDQVSPIRDNAAEAMHWDPGPYWDWNHYMDLIGAKKNVPTVPSAGKVVTISPNFKTNQPTVIDCGEDGSVCTTQPKQPTNLIYLRTQPTTTAPLLTDAVVHPDGSAGSYTTKDVSASATSGQKFVVADRKGDWTAVWFNGQKGWFENKQYKATATTLGQTPRVIPKSNKPVSLYGRAYPEDAAYPAGITPDSSVALGYTIQPGQSYPIAESNPTTDYYFNSSIDRRNPLDETVVKGKDVYLMISYNHRQYFVKAADVTIVR